MAVPVLEFYDSLGVLIPSGTPISFASVVPGTPTAEIEIELRNNDAGSPPVDAAENVKLRGYSRADGSSADPSLTGSAFQEDRALRVRVKSTGGEASAAVTGWRPLGSGNSLDLGRIPDGGTVTLGVRIETTIAAALQDVEAFLSLETLPSTPLPDGTFEALGNFVHDGNPAGADYPDADFSQILDRGNTSITPNGPADDTINLPSTISYTLQGTDEVLSTGSSSTFTAIDGDAAALLATEAYFAVLTLGAGGGTGALNVTKGSKAVAPLDDTDMPTLPSDEILYAVITVPFGLAIDTAEIDERGQLGFFGVEEDGGLDITVGHGHGNVGNFLVKTTTETSLTLADASTLSLFVLPNGTLTTATTGTFPTEDSRAMEIRQFTTAAGSITVNTDVRRFGTGTAGAGAASVTTRLDRMQALFGDDYNALGTYEERVAFGSTLLQTAYWGELTPFSSYASGNNYPRLFTADTPINLKAASDSANDDNSGGTGAQQLSAVYLDSTFAEVQVDVLLNGTTPAAVFASALGIVSARVSVVGTGGQQDGNIGIAQDGSFTAGRPTGNWYGDIPLLHLPSPIPADEDAAGADMPPAGATTGVVVAVPASRLGALARLTVDSEGPAAIQVIAYTPTGPFVLFSANVPEGQTPYIFDAPQWISSAGAPSAIPAETWIVAKAISRGVPNQFIYARLAWILL